MKGFTKLTVAIAFFSICGFLNAETIYQTGFEKPSYSTGNLSGHNGWYESGGGAVENSFAYSGKQAVGYNTSSKQGEHIDSHDFSYNSLTDSNQLVTFSVEAYFTGDTKEDWEVFGVFSSEGYMGQLEVFDGSAVLGLADSDAGAVPIAFDAWNQYSLVYNFSTDTMSAYVNGTLIGSGAFVIPSSTDLTTVSMGYNDKHGKSSDQAYFDDLSVTATAAPAPIPEPADFSLIACGLLAGFGAFRSRILAAISERS